MSIPLAITNAIVPSLTTALTGVIENRWSLTAWGYNGQQDPAGDKLILPAVSFVVTECAPLGFRSKLRQYPFIMRVETHNAASSDPHQADMYALAHAVSVWLCASAELTVAGCVIDSIYFDAPPEPMEGIIQGMQWTGTIHAKIP
jgi:hypothetical protein